MSRYSNTDCWATYSWTYPLRSWNCKRRIEKYKSPGIYLIPAELIQDSGNSLLTEIYKLVLAVWKKEMLPEQWKESIIEPIYKKGEKTNCSNYLGISPHMYMKLLGTINVVLDVTDRLLTIYFVFDRYWRKMGVWWHNRSIIHRFQKGIWFC